MTSNEVKSTKDEVKKAYHEMLALVDKAINAAQTTLDNAMNTVKSKATELENKANGELDKLLNPLRTKLNGLIAKAKELGNYIFLQLPRKCVKTHYQQQLKIDDFIRVLFSTL